MRALDRYNYQDDVGMHPLWLGILILCCVILTVGVLCCIRIKYGRQLYYLFTRKSEHTNDRVTAREMMPNDDKHTVLSLSYNKWTTVDEHFDSFAYNPIDDTEEKSHANESNQVFPLSSNNPARNSEIARKFYASMRNTSQHPKSASIDSYNSDSSLKSNYSSSITAQSHGLKREQDTKLMRTPCFFHSVPYTDGLALSLE